MTIERSLDEYVTAAARRVPARIEFICYRDTKAERDWLKRFCAQEAMPYAETRQRLLAGGALKKTS